MNSIDTVKKADVIKRIVARCIASKTWRSACEKEVLDYAQKSERKIVETFVREQFEAAGAGFNGRWQN